MLPDDRTVQRKATKTFGKISMGAAKTQVKANQPLVSKTSTVML